MDKQELIDFLKKNLRIEVVSDWDHAHDRSRVYVQVRLLLEGEEISSDRDYFSIDI